MSFVFIHDDEFSLRTLISNLKLLRELESKDEAGKLVSDKQREYLRVARQWRHESCGELGMHYLEWKYSESIANGEVDTAKAILELACKVSPKYCFLPYYTVGQALCVETNADLDYDAGQVLEATKKPGAWVKISDWCRWYFEQGRDQVRRAYAAMDAYNKRCDVDQEVQSALDKACEAVEYRDLWGKDMRGGGDHFELVSKRDAKEFI